MPFNDDDLYALPRPTPEYPRPTPKMAPEPPPAPTWVPPPGDCYMCGGQGHFVNLYDEGRFFLSFCSGCFKHLEELSDPNL